MHLKVSSAKWSPFDLGLNALTIVNKPYPQQNTLYPTQYVNDDMVTYLVFVISSVDSRGISKYIFQRRLCGVALKLWVESVRIELENK